MEFVGIFNGLLRFKIIVWDFINTGSVKLVSESVRKDYFVLTNLIYENYYRVLIYYRHVDL